MSGVLQLRGFRGERVLAQLRLERHNRAIELLHVCVARQGRVPDERYARIVGLEDHRVQPALLVYLTASTEKPGVVPEKQLRQHESEIAFRVEALQRQQLTT